MKIMSTIPKEAFWLYAENAAARLREEKIAEAAVLCFSKKADTYRLLNSSGAGNRAYKDEKT